MNIGNPDYNHNIDILLRSIIDRANLRRSATSSSTTDHQPLHLHHSGSASTSTTYLQQQQRQQETIDIGIIGTIYNLDPEQPLFTTYTSSTTSPFQRQLPPEHRHLQPHHNICMINNIESPEDEHREEFDSNSYILQSMRIIHDNNHNVEAWTGTIINHDNFSASLRQLQLHPQNDEPNLYINNIRSDFRIILFIIHDIFICISKRDVQQDIVNNLAPEGAQLINIEVDNIDLNDNISADIINLTYLDFIQQPHLQQRLPIQRRQALLHPQHRLDHHCDHHSQQQLHQHLLGIIEEDDNQQQEYQPENEDNTSEDNTSEEDSG